VSILNLSKLWKERIDSSKFHNVGVLIIHVPRGQEAKVNEEFLELLKHHNLLWVDEKKHTNIVVLTEGGDDDDDDKFTDLLRTLGRLVICEYL
jgi:hypothetical protein